MNGYLRPAFFLVALLTTFVFPLESSAQPPPGWPMLGNTAAHVSTASDALITASGAPSTGIAWMTNLYSPDLGSPVIAYNAVLAKLVGYVGNERGDVFAVDVTTGQVIWGVNLGINTALRATPAVAPDGSVWVGTHYNPTIFKLNGATGAIMCSSKAAFAIDGSPIVAQPPGGVESVYYQVVDGNPIPGPIVALNESNCKRIFNFTKYIGLGGGWSTPAYGISATREPLVLTGDADPDETYYAIDAITGKRVWYFQTEPNQHGQDWDIGSAATISPPRFNGFADGVAYINNKSGYEWALDFTTGAVIWTYNMFPNGGTIDVRSGTALYKNVVVIGNQAGVVALNAISGAPLWKYNTPLEVISSPAVLGAAQNEVVAFGDVMGQFHLLALANGTSLYTHQTGSYISSSPAEANGQILIASSDGFLYSFKLNGSNATPPTSTITSPANHSRVANPNGNLTITGTALDAVGVGAVEIAIQANGTSGPWYNATTGAYGPAPKTNFATLANPGASSSTWSFNFPAPPAGGTFNVTSNAVNVGHIIGVPAKSTFTILPSGTAPVLSATSTDAPPGGSFRVSGSGFGVNDTVTFTLFGQNVATVKTKLGTGIIPPTVILVPTTAPFGQTAISAVGSPSQRSSTLTVQVTNQWTQLGGGPQRTGTELNDMVISRSVGLGKKSVLQLAWDYTTGAPINSSPAIFNGIAFVGNDLGVLSAVVTNSGAPQWTYSTSSAAPIRSSPAVDPAGNVIFGANDGNLYTLTASGALSSTVALGGNLNSPAVANDQTYIGSSTGNLFDVGEPNGNVIWKATLTMPVTSPAYDSTAGIVVVGDLSGAVTAFNSVSGAQLWQVVTHGPITAVPSIFNGVVYAGSGDGNLYALKENSGAMVWQFTADSPIVGDTAIFPTGELAVGSQNGTLYKLASNGTIIETKASSFFGSAIVGVATVDTNIAVETIAGQASITRNNPPEQLWTYQTGAGLTTTPAFNDGTVYIAAGDGGLYAFTPEGNLPPALRKRSGRHTTFPRNVRGPLHKR